MSSAAPAWRGVPVSRGAAALRTGDRAARATDPSRTAPTSDSGHLVAVDVVRLVTLVGVIAVHVTSLSGESAFDAGGALLVAAHVTREVFVFVSALVLARRYRDRPLGAVAWWRRRYPLVVVPYLAWSAFYVLTGPTGREAPAHVVGTLLVDLGDGGAHFHLYFLVLTMQLYLVLPALLPLVARWRRGHVPLVVASLVWQLGFTAAVHYGWRPPILRVWLDHPGSWLPSYELYVVAGLVAAEHLEDLTAWVRRHPASAAAAWGLTAGIALASYRVDRAVLHYSPVHAADVWQPAVVLGAAGALLAEFAVGGWLVERLGAPGRRRLTRTSDASFGVYLAHPIVVAAGLRLLDDAGAGAPSGGAPGILHELLVLVLVVPLAYTLSYAGVRVARRTPLSLAVSGRRRAHDARRGDDVCRRLWPSMSLWSKARSSIGAAASIPPADFGSWPAPPEPPRCS